MTETAHQVADKLAITEQLTRYARGVDTHDWDLWKSVFTDDAIVDYSSATGLPAASRDDTATFLADSMPFLPWKQHYITNVEIEIDGDCARVRAAFYNPMQLPGLPEPSACGGYYHHQFVRTADGWKSEHLVEESCWFVNPFPSTEPAAATATEAETEQS